MVTSLRLRLAVWYATLLALILAATATVSYGYHSISHYDDVDRALASTVSHLQYRVQAGGGEHLAGGSLAIPPFEEHVSPEIFVRLYDAGGDLVASSSSANGRPGADPRAILTSSSDADPSSIAINLMRSLIHASQPALPEGGRFLTFVSPETGERIRFYAMPVVIGGALQGYLEAGESLAGLDHSMDRLRMLLTIGSVAGLFASLLGGWLIAASALRPVAAMAGTARAIALSRNLSKRLPRLNRRDELGQLAETFNEMLASLDEAYRTQQRFIADASHELRAPLTSILGNLELLERAPDLSDAEKAEALTYAREEARRMTRLVSDLLVLARADAGQTVKMRPVELDRVLMDVAGENQARARNRKLLITELDEAEVEGDPDRLKQLLLILVDNAVRYTSAGDEIRIGLRKEPGWAVVTVADTGIGIEAEDLSRIFERFYRADKARSRDQGGSGLGLPIAQWITDRHGGTITAESTPGQGSVFTVRLPLRQAPGPLNPGRPRGSSASSLSC